MNEEQFRLRKRAAVTDLSETIQYTPQKSPYDQQVGGHDYQIAIERTRRLNAKLDRADHLASKPVLEVIEGLQKCTTVDEVWQFILKSLAELKRQTSFEGSFGKEGGGVNWSAVFDAVQAEPYFVRVRLLRTAQSLKTVYNKFWV